jgi:hypothetical protein
LALLYVLVTGTPVNGQRCAEEAKYRRHVFVFDCYQELFGPTHLGKFRQRVWEDYLRSSPEGQRRAAQAREPRPEVVWSRLTVEEKSTFLAITAALAGVTERDGPPLAEWMIRLDAVHGETDALSGRRFDNDEAFRLYFRVTERALSHLMSGRGLFQNVCRSSSLGYNGLGSTHPDYCRQRRRFDNERKTDNFPNLQFNYTPGSPCVDVDVDYDRGIPHLRRDNSNVLARGHAAEFTREYCDPGFRMK